MFSRRKKTNPSPQKNIVEDCKWLRPAFSSEKRLFETRLPLPCRGRREICLPAISLQALARTSLGQSAHALLPRTDVAWKVWSETPRLLLNHIASSQRHSRISRSSAAFLRNRI